ncbi:MAG: hypothetical protein KBB83_01150 [Alphaproteobacteria bacterium]|nr:hypothetical protein [Alphaproteobacteria bacterium]
MYVVGVTYEDSVHVGPDVVKAHQDFIINLLQPYLLRRTVETGIRGLEPEGVPRYSRLVRYYFNSLEDYEKSWAVHHDKIILDGYEKMNVPFYIQLNEVVYDVTF